MTAAKRRAQAGMPSMSEVKKDFRKTMAEMSKEILRIENEKTRTSLLENVESSLMCLKEIRDYDQLIDMVCSDIDFLRMHIARGLYGLLDPRTLKIMEDAAERAMYRA
jgi:hypothetical protein